MKHVFGLNEYLYRQKNTQQNVAINTQGLINGHLLLTGMSGTGKSYHQAKRLIKSAIQQNFQVDILISTTNWSNLGLLRHFILNQLNLATIY